MSEATTDQPEADLEAASTPADDGVDTSTDIDADDDTDQDEADGDDADGQSDETDDDSEEIEVKGAKYKIPKAVKPLLLMQEDYTKKTQEVADQRRALESRETEITQKAEQRAEFQKANLAEFAKLHTIDADIAAYQALTAEQWEALKAKDIDAYREHKDSFRDLKDERDTIARALAAKETEANQEREKVATEAHSNSRKAMADVLTGRAKTESGHDLTIPDLTVEKLNAIGKFAAEAFGVTAEELSQITDPRILKALDESRLYRAGQAKAKKVERVEASQKTTPAKTVGGAATHARKTTDASGDGLSDEEWMRRENERLAAKRRPNRR